LERKARRTVIITFLTSIFAVCFFNVQLAKAQTLPAKYNMNLKFDASTKILTGKEDVIIKNSSGKDLKNLVFHLYADSYNKKETMPAFSYMGKEALTDEQKGDITIANVTINSKEMKFTQDDEILKINLDNLLKSNDELKVSIDFKLKLPKGSDRLGYINDVYSFTNWYPILSIYDSKEEKWDENTFNPIGESNYSDVSDYNININIPKNFVAASTGKEISEDSDDKTKTLNLNASDARDFVLIMSPYFKVLSKESDGIKINSYYISKDDKSDSKVSAEKVLDTTVSAVKFFSDKFGKYPYEDLDMVETYLSGGAMEYPELVQMPKYFEQSSNAGTSDDSMGYMYENSFICEAAVHEVGHQWWYVTVGNNEFKESFLDESVTSFSTAYYFEKTEGQYSQNSVAASLRRRIPYNEDTRSESSSPCINSSVDKFKSMMDYDSVIYDKGALLFEDLRKQVGEDKFLNIMQTYFNQYKFKNGSISGFLDIVEKIGGKGVRDSINSSLNSSDYNPQNLKLSDEENQKIDDEQLKEQIKNMEAQKGIVIGSICLRILNGEKVIVAVPSNLNKEQQDALLMPIKGRPGIDEKNLIIKQDKDLSEDDIKNNNLILMGNPWNDKALNAISQDLPIIITKMGICSSNCFIKGDNISGCFATKNPKNPSKIVLVSFSTKEGTYAEDIDFYGSNQFSINVDGKQNYSGDF
jgi:hypothetical protein